MTSYSDKLNFLSISSQNQNKAPVLDFKCLFTRDIQRKQKRWQDGRLKFHTFNKRIMVHDERSNFVGDSYRQEDHDLEEGEELSLERSGILVEIGEYLGKKDQDLNQLVESRVKRRKEKVNSNFACGPPANSTSTIFQRKITESNNLCTNPPALIGGNQNKLLPNKPSLENTYKISNDLAHRSNGKEKPIKRRKRSKSPSSNGSYAQNLVGTRVIFSTKPSSSATIHFKPVTSKSITPNSSRITIDLTKDDKDVEKSCITEEVAKSQNKARPSNELKNDQYYDSTGAYLALTTSKNFSNKRLNCDLTLISEDILSKNPKSKASSIIEDNARFRELEEEISTKFGCSSPKSPNLSSRIIEAGCNSESNSRSKSRLFENLLDKQAGKANSKPGPPIVRCSTPETHEVNFNAKRHQNLCNATSNIYPVTRKNQNQPKSTLRIKPRPPRKMMFLENSINPLHISKNSLSNKNCSDYTSKIGSDDLIMSKFTSESSNLIRGVPILREYLSSSPLRRNSIQINHKHANEKVNELCCITKNNHDHQINHTTLLHESEAYSTILSENDRLANFDSISPKRRPSSKFIEYNKVGRQLPKDGETESSPSHFVSNQIHHFEISSSQKSSEDKFLNKYSPEENIHSILDDNTNEFSSREGRACENILQFSLGAQKIVDGSNLPFTSNNLSSDLFMDNDSASIANITPNLQPEKISLNEKFAELGTNSLNKPEKNTDRTEKYTVVLDSMELFSNEEKRTAIFLPHHLSRRSKSVNPEVTFNPEEVTVASLTNSATKSSKAASKALISNPATRGLSLQTVTANTIDALNLTSNPVSPLSRPLSWSDNICGTNAPIAAALEKKVSALGPWSRESFDLFGISKPS